MCIFKWLTGLPCPGCGMTRAWVHFFHGEMPLAFYFHPLFWLIPFFLLLFLFRKKRWASFFISNSWFWRMGLFLVIGIYVFRMLTMFPEQAPLDFESSALLPQLFDKFQLILR